MSNSEFLLPDVGEGLTEAEIVSWKVTAGEQVTVNQTLVEIETAKSIVELPSPFAGTVTAVLVGEGVTVDVGTPIITVSSDGEAPAPAPTDETTDAVADTADTISPDGDSTESGAVLVGYGIKGGAQSRRRRGAHGASAPEPQSVAGATAASGSAGVGTAGGGSTAAGSTLAKPPIRKLAKDLGVELGAVEPTGDAGEVTRDDVMRHSSQKSVFRNLSTPEWGDEREERIPVKGVRKAIANAMVTSAFSAPHVGLFVDVDATRTMEFVRRLKASGDFAGIKVSPLLIFAKAMIWAVRRNPTVNSTWTDEEIIVHHYVNFGFAAATPRGLVVPNVKDAQNMSLRELAMSLEEMTNIARDGKLQPADMSNGTITLTNIGVFGMDTGTPILNPGEVAIVALGTIKQKPWVVDGEIMPRYVTTLGASFDHRIVDGDVASRFLADVASVIEEPALLLD